MIGSGEGNKAPKKSKFFHFISINRLTLPIAFSGKEPGFVKVNMALMVLNIKPGFVKEYMALYEE